MEITFKFSPIVPSASPTVWVIPLWGTTRESKAHKRKITKVQEPDLKNAEIDRITIFGGVGLGEPFEAGASNCLSFRLF